uniref:MIT_C domain-containing protein n=1 Tax=Rhabditophanes sp. KR3021 TaxID=114890 RepID=A0AC35U201_9BILA
MSMRSSNPRADKPSLVAVENINAEKSYSEALIPKSDVPADYQKLIEEKNRLTKEVEGLTKEVEELKIELGKYKLDSKLTKDPRCIAFKEFRHGDPYQTYKDLFYNSMGITPKHRQTITEVTIEDPYFQTEIQEDNLFWLIEDFKNLCPMIEKITIITKNYHDQLQEDLTNHFKCIDTFEVILDENLHDRWFRFNNGVSIPLSRGLDIYGKNINTNTLYIKQFNFTFCVSEEYYNKYK